jgi:alanine dehydrogenase
VARTSTFALNNATSGHAIALADKGWRQALRDNPHLAAGLNVASGQVTCEPVANQLGHAYTPVARLLG